MHENSLSWRSDSMRLTRFMSMGSTIVLASIGMAGGGRNMYSDVSVQFLYINGITYMTGENRLAG